MSATRFASIDQAFQQQGAAAAVETLILELRESQNYDRLFDALLLKVKYEHGWPLSRPAGWEGVPETERQQFEEAYTTAAREVGQLLIQANDLPRAWVYFRTIREPKPIFKALAAIDPSTLSYEQADELIAIALHEGANRVAGVRMLLTCHGTCNTVTILDQILHTLTPEERRAAAALLVNDVYDTLVLSLQRETAVPDSRAVTPVPEVSNRPDTVEETQAASPFQSQFQSPVARPGTVRQLIFGRDDLFAENGYHVDVSHLHAVVRFARALHATDPEFALARELAEYGTRLAPQFHYAADIPFDEFYKAQAAYFSAVANEAGGFEYFRERLAQEPDPADRQMIAYVLCDLFARTHREQEAVEIAARELSDLEEPNGFSFARLCIDAGRLDLLKQAAAEAHDAVRYTIARLAET